MFRVENLKKFVVDFFMFMLVFIMLLVVPAIGDTIQHNYKQPCVVYEVTDTYTTFIDPVGYLWDVFDTDYKKGDEVIVYFHDNFTDFDREDDIIKKVNLIEEIWDEEIIY